MHLHGNREAGAENNPASSSRIKKFKLTAPDVPNGASGFCLIPVLRRRHARFFPEALGEVLGIGEAYCVGYLRYGHLAVG